MSRRWKRTVSRYGRVTWMRDGYTIERREYTLPVRSVGYTLTRAGEIVGRYDRLADAKDAAEDGSEVVS